METKKLYYEDSHLKEFSATVIACEQVKNGWAVTLDATAFYPTGGGQNCDLGTLGSANVLDVKEQGEEIIHLCDQPLEVGSIVAGAIDWQLAQITGTGCLLGMLCGCYLSVDRSINALVTACAVLGISGELSQTEKGNGTFFVNLMDNLSVLKNEQIEKLLNIEVKANEEL